MTDWVVWLVVAGVLLLAELFTLTFVLGLFAVAATAAALPALFGQSLAWQVTVFALTSGLLWALIRPLARLHRREPSVATGTRAMTGRPAVVAEEVTRYAGRVTVGGESWAARTEATDAPLTPGSHVTISHVDGATLVVTPEEN